MLLSQVEDPYRWLEDPTSPEVQAWVDAENECTDAYFSQLKDDKAKFVKRMSELVGAPAQQWKAFRRVGRRLT